MTNPGSDELARVVPVGCTDGLTLWSCQQELLGKDCDGGLQGDKNAYRKGSWVFSSAVMHN